MENLAYFSIRSMLNCTQKQSTLAGEFGECEIKDIKTSIHFSAYFFFIQISCWGFAMHRRSVRQNSSKLEA